MQQYPRKKYILYLQVENYWNKQSAGMLKNKLNVNIKDEFSYIRGGSPMYATLKKLQQYATNT